MFVEAVRMVEQAMDDSLKKYCYDDTAKQAMSQTVPWPFLYDWKGGKIERGDLRSDVMSVGI